MCTRSSRSLWRCAEAHLPTFTTQAEHQLAVAANLGLALQNSGRLDESLSVHDRVLRVLPTNSDTHHNRGNALYQAARHAEAMASFDALVLLTVGKSAMLFSDAVLVILEKESWRVDRLVADAVLVIPRDNNCLIVC